MEESDRQRPGVRWDRLVWAAIAVGAVLRLVWVLAINPPDHYLVSDMAGYVERAMRLASGEELIRTDAFYPPGTHMLLAVPFRVFGTGDGGLTAAALLWWALSSVTPFFAWRMARRLISPQAAALTAVLCALYPLFIFYAGFFTSETPALALLLAALWLGYRARQTVGRAAILSAAAAGLAGGAVLANRPQFILNLAIVAGPLLWRSRSVWGPAAAFVAGAVLVLAGVVAHNSSAADRLTLLSENGGMVFYQGHCDVRLVTAGSPERGTVLSFGNPVAFELNRGRDASFPNVDGWDQGFFYDKGLKCARDSGLGHASRLWRNLVDAGPRATPFPLGIPERLREPARGVNVAYCLLLVPILAGAAFLIARRRESGGHRGTGELLLHLLCLVPVVVLFSSEPRYRIPYDVFGLALLASLIVVLVAARRRTAA